LRDVLRIQTAVVFWRGQTGRGPTRTEFVPVRR
jgi:hypothetical protein